MKNKENMHTNNPKMTHNTFSITFCFVVQDKT